MTRIEYWLKRLRTVADGDRTGLANVMQGGNTPRLQVCSSTSVYGYSGIHDFQTILAPVHAGRRNDPPHDFCRHWKDDAGDAPEHFGRFGLPDVARGLGAR